MLALAANTSRRGVACCCACLSAPLISATAIRCAYFSPCGPRRYEYTGVVRRRPVCGIDDLRLRDVQLVAAPFIFLGHDDDQGSSDLLSLSRMSLVELREKYIFKSGEVWRLPASGRKILIRQYDERLFALICHDMNLERVGFKSPSPQCKALLAGTPGTGTSTFMWVAMITFIKMVKADPSVESVRLVDLQQRTSRTKLMVAVFNPHVSGLRIRCNDVARAEMVYIGHDLRMGCKRTVRLFDAGPNLTPLPCAQTGTFVFATSSADPNHYERWMRKDAIQPRFFMPWTWGEIQALARVVGRPELECLAQFEMIGGNPRGVFHISKDGLSQAIGEHMTGLAKRDFDKVDQITVCAPRAGVPQRFRFCSVGPLTGWTPRMTSAIAETTL